jgi:hypothetical protein
VPPLAVIRLLSNRGCASPRLPLPSRDRLAGSRSLVNPFPNYGGLSQLQRDIRIRERWLELVRQLDGLCPWETFIKACATKVDLQTKWRPIMAQHLGVDGVMLNVREDMGYVPYEWLEQVMAMPDLGLDAIPMELAWASAAAFASASTGSVGVSPLASASTGSAGSAVA